MFSHMMLPSSVHLDQNETYVLQDLANDKTSLQQLEAPVFPAELLALPNWFPLVSKKAACAPYPWSSKTFSPHSRCSPQTWPSQSSSCGSLHPSHHHPAPQALNPTPNPHSPPPAGSPFLVGLHAAVLTCTSHTLAPLGSHMRRLHLLGALRRTKAPRLPPPAPKGQC